MSEYIAYFGNGGYLDIGNITDPGNPLELGKILTPSVVTGVVVSGVYAHVTDVLGGLRIIDISDPTDPFEVGLYDTWAIPKSWFSANPPQKGLLEWKY